MTNDNQDLLKPQIKSLISDEPIDTPHIDIDQTENAFIQMAEQLKKSPGKEVSHDILAKLKKLNNQQKERTTLSLQDLPMLNKDSNWLDWAEVVKNIELPKDVISVHLHSLESNETRDLFLAVVQEEVPEEVHHDLLESFILLEGTCTCSVHKLDGTVQDIHMREGDYISFELGEHHDICITSKQPAKAILQWLKVA